MQRELAAIAVGGGERDAGGTVGEEAKESDTCLRFARHLAVHHVALDRCRRRNHGIERDVVLARRTAMAARWLIVARGAVIVDRLAAAAARVRLTLELGAQREERRARALAKVVATLTPPPQRDSPDMPRVNGGKRSRDGV